MQSLAALPAGTVLDGEVAVLNELGISDFDRLQKRSLRRGRPPGSDAVTYCAFDMLFLAGEDLRTQPLELRKALLESVLAELQPASVLYVQDIPGHARWMYRQALEWKLEGVVAKRLTSTYQPGVRSMDWLKVKRPGAVLPGRFKRCR